MAVKNKIEPFLKRKRYDYFVIWGHGLKYKSQIIEELRKTKDVKILKIIKYKPKSISKFVKKVYSHDYAPFWHLKGKTEYLLKTPREVAIIFIENMDAREKVMGEGLFKHIECQRITEFKRKIRKKFNPREKGKISENHVIHASDNENQTDKILKKLYFLEGIGLFSKNSNPVIDVPHYFDRFDEFEIKEINSDEIYCTIIQKKAGKKIFKNMKIEETPQYQFLKGNVKAYKEYLDEFYGEDLQADYGLGKLKKLSVGFKYLDKNHETEYIIVKEVNGKYIIEDGVHRAAILKFKSEKSFPVAVIK